MPDDVQSRILAADHPSNDGRRKRSQRSRRKIVDAMFRLIRAGDFSPGAAAIADEANVSLRTVFRQFEEMDTLYREMNADMEAAILPRVREPFVSKDWRGRLDELLQRRSDIYEEILPVKTAAGLRRYQSEFLREDHRRFLDMERTHLHDILPDEVRADIVRLAGLEVATSFEAWRRLRYDQELPAAKAAAVVRSLVDALLRT